MSNFRLLTVAVLTLGLAIMSGCAKKEVSIQIKGSDTEVNLVQRLAEAFIKKNPEVTISVTGGGSGVGIAALIDKKTDIANSSRLMKDEEINQAKNRGVEPVGIVFAIDGLALIVHKDLPVDSLSLDEIGQIYRGEITNWKEVGGPALEISLYGRTSASGTYIYFRDTVLKGDYSPKMKGMIGNSHIVEAVKNDKSGIGYVGIGYIVDEKGEVTERLKPLNIKKAEAAKAVSALDIEAVKSGLYPLTRPLYQYIDGKLNKDLLLEFIRFELSEEGQKLVLKEGFYPVTKEYMEANRRLGIIK